MCSHKQRKIDNPGQCHRQYIIGEYKVQLKDASPAHLTKGVSVLSTFLKSSSIGDQCQNVVEHVRESCLKHPNTHLARLAIYGSHKSNAITNCLSTLARPCNSQVQHALDVCKLSRNKVNFLQLDYPNYPGPGGKTVVEIAYEENMRMAQN